MKYTLVSVLLFLLGISMLNSQNFKFEYSEDSLIMDNNIKSLAKELIKMGYDETKTKDLNDLFRIQISAKNYFDAITSLKKLRVLYEKDYDEFSKVVGIQYEMYSLMKLKEQNSKVIDFDNTLDSIYSHVTETTKEDSFFYFDIDIQKAKGSFKEDLKKTKKSNSINKEDAIKLCRSYAYYLTALHISNKGKTYVKKAENKKFIIQDSLFITTRDNAKLSAIIYRNRSDTLPMPVILKFSIYPGESDLSNARMSASSYGYIGISVNTRGKRNSPDEIVSFEKDGEDLYDVIDWISKQPWCNGKIGMYGGSYLGFAQWAVNKNPHPALKTIVPMVAVGTGVDYPMYNNVFYGYMLRWIHYVENNKFTDREEFRDSKRWDSLYYKWYKKGSAFNTLDSLDKRPNKTFQRWLSHPTYDKYWQNMMPYKEDFSKINIPILTFTGYFDSDQVGALHYYKEHHKYNSKANHYLVIGPYDHYGVQGFPEKILQGYKIDSVADIRQIPMTYKWFNF